MVLFNYVSNSIAPTESIYYHPTRITGLPPPVISVSSEGTLRAGENYILTCTIFAIDGIVESALIEANWTGPGGSTDFNETRIVNIPNNSGNTIVLSLEFQALMTSHGGQYTCTGFLTIPDISLTKSSTSIADVTVQSKFRSTNIMFSESKLFCSHRLD